jgi:sporulation protein YlmC with PRC-barrel domain
LAGILIGMLQLSNSLLNQPVLSLRTGTTVAVAVAPIINPDNLKIEGFYCQDSHDKYQLILLCQDIREILDRGFVIDDHDVLAEADELVRLKKVLDLDYQLIGKHVITVSKERVGKVSDYAVEVNSMMIQKIYVAQSIMKSLTGGSLSIDRSQINEITPKRVIINELTKKAPATAPATA